MRFGALRLGFGLIVAFLNQGAARAADCQPAGVVTRIEGAASMLAGGGGGLRTSRRGGASARLAVMSVVCVGDRIRASGNTIVHLSLDGRGLARVDASAPFDVPPPPHQSVLVTNAYNILVSATFPDANRSTRSTSLRGPDHKPLRFRVRGLQRGEERVTVGSRALIVRLDGGLAPYAVVLLDSTGREVARAPESGEDVTLPITVLTPGKYRLIASDSAGAATTAQFTAVADDPPWPAEIRYPVDPDTASAMRAVVLARREPYKWSFEAEQALGTRLGQAWDMQALYSLIETDP